MSMQPEYMNKCGDVLSEDRCWECHEFIEVEAGNNAYCLKCLALCGANEP